MVFDATCSRLRLGGSISGSVLSGGTTIDAGGIAISTQSGLYQFPGYRGSNPALLGSDGTFHRTGKPYRAKSMVLNFRAYTRDATGTVTTTKREHLEANLEDIFTLIAGSGERALLERDMADGTTRWIEIQAEAAAFVESPIFNKDIGAYDLPVLCAANYPFWQSEAQTTTAITGAADNIVNLGNARISNGSYAFSAAATLTNNTGGEVLTATAAVTIDVGTRTISNAGSPTPGRMDPPSDEFWYRPGPGTTSHTASAGTVTAIWRSHWH